MVEPWALDVAAGGSGILIPVNGLGFEDPRRIFVSYAGPDRAWADQVVAALEGAAGSGVAVTVSHRDFPAGGNAVLAISRAIDEADVAVILLSRSYLEEPRYTTEEWNSALSKHSGPALTCGSAA
jgi:hypothetical protein